MKASNFSDARKAFILKQGDDGVLVAEICRKASISQATCFKWRRKHAGLLPDEMRRLKAHWFLPPADSREKLATWRRYYNEDRPHSAIGDNVPIAGIIPAVQPARHRDKSWKTPASGDPTSGLSAGSSAIPHLR